MELSDGSRIGVIGGGPAGSLTAIFLLDLAASLRLRLQVDIYEPKGFFQTGPTGCNMCGGVISESLMQMMAAEGIRLPDEVVIDTINAYVLHTDAESVAIEAPRHEMRIATIFRGGGPKGAESQRPLPWDSFDWFLLKLAMRKGARHIPHRVVGLVRDETGRPVIRLKELPAATYDLLVGAVGLNQGPSLHLFQDLGFGYRPPRSGRAHITELYYGQEAVDRLLGNAMHVFLLDIPRLKFAAITPKGHYATLIILGEEIDEAMVDRLLRTPAVRACLPPGWEIPVQPCQCQPRINLGPPENPYGDRVVLVGDASVSRLYKDGIGASFRMAKACAMTALTHGIAAADFRRHYWPVCREMAWDNRLGHALFALDRLFHWLPALRRGMMRTVRREQCRDYAGYCPLCSALWNTFTGSASYREIWRDMLRPGVLIRMLLESLKGPPGRGSPPPADAPPEG